MSKKNKRKAAGQAPAVWVPQIRRLLEKGDAKHALKEARDLCRRDPAGGHRQLLAEVCLARAAQLQRDGCLEQARAVYDEFQSLGVCPPGLQPRVAELRIRLGVLAASGGGAPLPAQLDPPTLLQLADEALLHPRRIAPAYGELKQQAELVRQALQAIERGAESEAWELLKNVPLKSPYADWKLFARGLAAHYAGDSERRAANWDRLDSQRPAFRIVRTLLVAWGVEKPSDVSGNMSDRLRRLAFATAGDPAAEHLRKLNGYLIAKQWRELLQEFRTFRMRYASGQRELVIRVTDVVWKHLAHEGLGSLLKRLAESGLHPALDPRWNRARASVRRQTKRV